MVLAYREAVIRNKAITYTKILNPDRTRGYWVEVVNRKGEIEQSYLYDNFKRALLGFHNMMINVKYS
jgi:hypothetical protein